MIDNTKITNIDLEQPKLYRISNIIKEIDIGECRILGDPEIEFSEPSTIWEGKKGAITFCYKEKIEDIIATLNKSEASVIVTEKNIEFEKIKTKNKIILLVENPGIYLHQSYPMPE